jgi:replicative DNA helicase
MSSDRKLGKPASYPNKPVKNRINGLMSEVSASLGKLPPQAVDLEAAVLGALMLEKDALTTVIEILRPESFYKDVHCEIYRAITDLFDNSEPVDILTVTQQLKKSGKLDFVGGPYYVTSLTNKVNSAANVEYHARIISEQHIKRDLIHISSEIQKMAYEDTTDVFNLLDKVEQEIFSISDTNIRKNYADMRSVLREAIDELESKKDQEGLTGIPSGFTELDRITSGWQRSDLVIIAARPGMGKTAFVLSSLRNAAIDFKMPVAIFSLEMSTLQLVNRLISSEAQLESEKIKQGKLADYEWEQLVHQTAPLSDAPIFIDDTPALSIRELRSKSRRLKAQHDVQLIIIDYLQLMSGETGQGNQGNREQEIASISRALKNLAKELNVPVIALSQLSRAVETRGGEKRPQLSDLRESGSIEQDADMVMFLYRPEYYGITEDETNASTQGVGEVIISKHRNGGLGTVKLKFIGPYTKFTDWDNSYNSFSGTTASGGYGEEFKSDGVMTFGSKANPPQAPGSSGPAFDPDDGEPPF